MLHRSWLLSLTIFCSLLANADTASAELRSLPTPDDASLPSVVLIGDSTVRNGDASGGNGQWGWGEPLQDLFQRSKVNVVNRAVGGLSSRTYLTFGYWESTKSLLKTGDYLLIQFGHNDASEINDDQRARGTIRGNGDETQRIVNQMTGKQEVVHSYGWYLRNYIREARHLGVHPIVCSPVPRKSWSGDQINRSASTYAGWARQAAASEHVPFIDLNEIIAERYDAAGRTKVESFFADKHTHTSLAGARLNARCVVAGMRVLEIGDLHDWLTASAQDIEAAERHQVDVPVARVIGTQTRVGDESAKENADASNTCPTLYLIGDSTVKNGHLDGVGWGETISLFFDPEKLKIVNRAIGGRSARSFRREKRWDDVWKELMPGDFVLMQFGHNDGGQVGDARFKRRPSLPGIGNEIQDVVFEDDSTETVHTYGWYLKAFCDGAIQKQAIPIVCSPVPHKDNWDGERFTPDFADHRRWCAEVAKAAGAHYIDLTALVGERYQGLGEEQVEQLFADKRTHTNKQGAKVNATCVVAGLQSIADLSVAGFFSDSRRDVTRVSGDTSYNSDQLE